MGVTRNRTCTRATSQSNRRDTFSPYILFFSYFQLISKELEIQQLTKSQTEKEAVLQKV